MPPKKASKATQGYSMLKEIPKGIEIKSDLNGIFIVGQKIGKGGFGCIYAGKAKGDKQPKYAIKIEPVSNGPLFSEIHFYRRMCKSDKLSEFKQSKNLTFLGMPEFVASGQSKLPTGEDCRFLVMPLFETDLESSLVNGTFSADTMPIVATQMLAVLQYMHSKSYVHGDIKASNILHSGCEPKFYLVDFGLVSLTVLAGKHRLENPDPKLRHNGTLEFCPRDSHRGLPVSRRSDIECLLINLVHWLVRCRDHSKACDVQAGLPWTEPVKDPAVRAKASKPILEKVAQMKEDCLTDVKRWLTPLGLAKFTPLLKLFESTARLAYEEQPDYEALGNLLMQLAVQLRSGVSKRASPVSRSVRASKRRSLPERNNSSVTNESLPEEKENKPVPTAAMLEVMRMREARQRKKGRRSAGIQTSPELLHVAQRQLRPKNH